MWWTLFTKIIVTSGGNTQYLHPCCRYATEVGTQISFFLHHIGYPCIRYAISAHGTLRCLSFCSHAMICSLTDKALLSKERSCLDHPNPPALAIILLPEAFKLHYTKPFSCIQMDTNIIKNHKIGIHPLFLAAVCQWFAKISAACPRFLLEQQFCFATRLYLNGMHPLNIRGSSMPEYIKIMKRYGMIFRHDDRSPRSAPILFD